MSDRKRRIVAFFVGVFFGSLYSLVAQYINVWALPGIPLYEPPLGRVELILLSSLVMGLLSMIVSWDQESFWGLIIAALVGVALSSIAAYINAGETETLKSVIVFVFTFLPRLVLFLPAGLLVRWAVNNLEDAALFQRGRMRRITVTVTVMVLIAVVGGRFSLYPEEAQRALREANELLLEGMPIEHRMDLPPSLQAVDGFVEYAEGAYTLEWNSDPDSLAVTRPTVGVNVLESLIIFRFENGFVFGCAYTPPSYKANCLHMGRLPPR